ncbi:MAG TPA: CorA family divalent cation transporter [Patescibacteria group bacterium]|nr:CorA family divalent cation transporter [Patescibacteria group bacterium]
MTIEALLARADGRDELIDLATWTPRSIPRDQLLWVDLIDPGDGDVATVREALQLSDQVVEALATIPARPDAGVLKGAIHVVIATPGAAPQDDPVPLQVILGEEWVITAHASPIAFLEEHRERVRDEREVGLLTPVQFLVAVLDWSIDAFFRLSETLEREVDRLDDAALRSDGDLLARLVGMRRRIARVRRLVGSHRELFAELQRPDFMPGIEPGEAALLASVASRLDRALEAVGRAREMLIGTFDVHMTRTAQRTNDIMKVLTLASAILLPASVIAGVMGMNFKLGFFDEPTMFWFVIAAMAGIALGTIGLARWRGWL